MFFWLQIIIISLFLMPSVSFAQEKIEHEVQSIMLKSPERPEVRKECSNDGIICLTSHVYKDRIVLYAKNNSAASRTFIIKYFLNNLNASMESPGKNIILRPSEEKKIEMLTVIDPNYNYGYNYDYNHYLGIIDAVHNDNYVYDLPFDIGQKYFLLQGVGGKFSHQKEEDYYAYDFKMPIGTPVLAAREGTVVKVIENFKEGGTNPALERKSNYIYIEHDDGTIGVYEHLKYKGSFVKTGDKVQKGQKIALSGNIGYTTNPHLHFGVLKAIRGGKFKSVPITIITSAGIFKKLEQGNYYEKIDRVETKKQEEKPKDKK